LSDPLSLGFAQGGTDAIPVLHDFAQSDNRLDSVFDLVLDECEVAPVATL
jgi:hypothetical protein